MLTRRVRALALLALVLTLSTLLAACTQTTPEPLELSEKDSGSTQTLAMGQQLVVTLESNQTPGFRWTVDGQVPPQLKQAGEPVYESESTLVGAGGSEVWTFEAVSVGEGDLKLKYWRSFEPPATPAETFEVTVKVE